MSSSSSSGWAAGLHHAGGGHHAGDHHPPDEGAITSNIFAEGAHAAYNSSPSYGGTTTSYGTRTPGTTAVVVQGEENSSSSTKAYQTFPSTPERRGRGEELPREQVLRVRREQERAAACVEQREQRERDLLREQCERDVVREQREQRERDLREQREQRERDLNLPPGATPPNDRKQPIRGRLVSDTPPGPQGTPRTEAGITGPQGGATSVRRSAGRSSSRSRSPLPGGGKALGRGNGSVGSLHSDGLPQACIFEPMEEDHVEDEDERPLRSDHVGGPRPGGPLGTRDAGSAGRRASAYGAPLAPPPYNCSTTPSSHSASSRQIMGHHPSTQHVSSGAARYGPPTHVVPTPSATSTSSTACLPPGVARQTQLQQHSARGTTTTRASPARDPRNSARGFVRPNIVLPLLKDGLPPALAQSLALALPQSPGSPKLLSDYATLAAQQARSRASHQNNSFAGTSMSSSGVNVDHDRAATTFPPPRRSSSAVGPLPRRVSREQVEKDQHDQLQSSTDLQPTEVATVECHRDDEEDSRVLVSFLDESKSPEDGKSPSAGAVAPLQDGLVRRTSFVPPSILSNGNANNYGRTVDGALPRNRASTTQLQDLVVSDREAREVSVDGAGRQLERDSDHQADR